MTKLNPVEKLVEEMIRIVIKYTGYKRDELEVWIPPKLCGVKVRLLKGMPSSYLAVVNPKYMGKVVVRKKTKRKVHISEPHIGSWGA